jgi:hypothetical protein
MVPNGQPAAPPAQVPAPVAPQAQPDPTQSFTIGDGNSMVSFSRIVFSSSFDNMINPTTNIVQDFGGMDFANPLTTSDVLNDFDFDSFLHDNNGEDTTTFDFNPGFMEGGEIGAE